MFGAASRAMVRTIGMSVYSIPRPRPYVISFSVTVRTNISGFFVSARRSATGPSTALPSASWPDGSMRPPGSFTRHSPMPSKFSSAKPSGSITR